MKIRENFKRRVKEILIEVEAKDGVKIAGANYADLAASIEQGMRYNSQNY